VVQAWHALPVWVAVFEAGTVEDMLHCIHQLMVHQLHQLRVLVVESKGLGLGVGHRDCVDTVYALRLD
jgi:hypothetical protein